MTDDQTIKKRIILFIKSLSIGQGAFEKQVGLSNGYINNIRKSIQSEKLQQIALRYPELNTGWLMTGNGKMLVVPQQDEPPQNGDIGLLKELLREKDTKIETQAKEIGRLEERIAHLSKRTISPLDAEDAGCADVAG